MLPRASSLRQSALWTGGAWRDYSALARPKLAFLSLIVVVLCYAIARPADWTWQQLVTLALGSIMALCAGSVLNQLLERDADALMKRTAGRPLPTGRLSPRTAALFAAILALAGLITIAAVSHLAAVWAIVGLAVYAAIYTPMKRRSSLSTIVGAVPGAIPVLMGWSAARGELDLEAWVLFVLLFLWQLPHFLAIAWMYRADYERAGFRMLPNEDPSGAMMARQVVGYTLALIPVSLAPAMLGETGTLYLVGAVAAGLVYLAYSWRLAMIVPQRRRGRSCGRR